MGRTKDKPPAGPERSESPSPAEVALFERAMADIKRHVPRERPAEEKALEEAGGYQQAFAQKNRFIPGGLES